jgi:flagellar basal-body rod protein FlgB
MISGLNNDGAAPVLEAMIRFASARQKLIAHNVANLDTPDFRPLDVSPQEFQRALARAVDRRRSAGGVGELRIDGSEQVRFGPDGAIELNPRTPSGNIMFHDRNNRDLERLMQANAENVAAFRVATDLLRSRVDIMRSAISERV